MKVLITGAGGLLARALIPRLMEEGHEVVALSRRELDVIDAGGVCARIMQEKPRTVIQCAAYTAVDLAESNQELAFQVNAEGTRWVAQACHKVGALLVYPSTDYVFSGASDRPYRPGDPTEPVNTYGRSKLAGEEAAREAGRYLIVRTGGLYGEGGTNFVDAIMRRATEVGRLEVVSDQRARPTWTFNLARTISALVECDAESVHHATDAGPEASWFEVAQAIVAIRGLAAQVVPITSEQAARPARRPRWSVLDCSSTDEIVGRGAPDWRASLRTYLGMTDETDSRAVLATCG